MTRSNRSAALVGVGALTFGACSAVLFASGDPQPSAAAPAQPAASPKAPAATPGLAADEKPLSHEVRADGLVIEDYVVGTGPEIQTGGGVVAHCTGSFDSGEVFFDTKANNQPVAFPLYQAIKGWQEGIPGMRVGGKRKLVCPPALAYGEAGKPPRIPPNSTLTFVVEAIDAVQSEDIVEGKGDPCPPGAKITFFYKGTLDDGTIFDSNVGKDPATFSLSQLIRGWQAGIPGMKAGGKRKLVVPYQLGYGEAGSGPIPPKARLTFEIELVSFQAPPTQQPPAH